jgi:hypothetical protein
VVHRPPIALTSWKLRSASCRGNWPRFPGRPDQLVREDRRVPRAPRVPWDRAAWLDRQGPAARKVAVARWVRRADRSPPATDDPCYSSPFEQGEGSAGQKKDEQGGVSLRRPPESDWYCPPAASDQTWLQ